MGRVSIADLEGGDALCAWFGAIPSFHDSELTELEIRQGSPSKLTAVTFRLGPEKDREGFLLATKRTAVTLHLAGLIEVELYEFQDCGYLDGMEFDSDDEGITISFAESAGVHGRIKARQISVVFEPR